MSASEELAPLPPGTSLVLLSLPDANADIAQVDSQMFLQLLQMILLLHDLLLQFHELLPFPLSYCIVFVCLLAFGKCISGFPFSASSLPPSVTNSFAMK